MARAFLRRLLHTALLILALLTTAFAVAHLAPGDPLDRLAPTDLDAAGREALRGRLGLDRPLPEQYARWLGGVLHGDLGRSLENHRPVAELLVEALPRTLLLAGTAYAVHWLLALPLGVLLAARRGAWAVRLLDGVGLMLYSLPMFWLGLMGILIFARLLGWLPAGGMISPAAVLEGRTPPLDLLRHLILPAGLLGLATAAGSARYLRTSLLEALGSDYVLAARARGLSERAVLWRHALRNALLPLVTLVGLDLPALLGGSV
ncbi:ABC transporter permease, partial [bacterium]|nr:ABC transporter permease [bacterium]